ncbi:MULTISPECIES: PTS mannitol transporter subunit IICB [Gracilibacillus]|uniref:PTS mannitol transporter subunit IICB n=1 Tax=Gracilibacillus TaxID=74385 RepID=UPI0008258295|nr:MULTISPECIES: PTS mannitol transporter subunit IICB [Gracilibacillus]
MSEQTSAFRAKIQKFGSNLSGMIMPNIGAFIAWGIITALFIPDGWTPNETMAQLVDPMINYLLPLLIGFTGGRVVYGARGGVVGATATMGVIVGADAPMFLGAMIMGPLAGYLMKKIDEPFQSRVRQGFEMLYNNFSAGILAALLAMLAVSGVGPIVSNLTSWLASGVEAIINAGLLPIASIIVEPAKALFLNNAINHGILTPLGADQATQAGKSILFLVEANPGPGLGILLAFAIFGTGVSKSSAPGAAIIQFLGGIHEIYFPYILMKPTLLIAAIFGGMSGIFTLQLFDGGLRAAASPGSIFAVLAMTPGDSYVGVILSVIIAASVSFVIAAFILKTSKSSEDDLAASTAKMEAMKGKKSSVSSALTGNDEKQAAQVEKVIFACDAGMGSSAMGASLLRKKFKDNNIDIEVTNKAINEIPADADIVITQAALTERARSKQPSAEHISVDNFLNSPKYDELVERMKNT